VGGILIEVRYVFALEHEETGGVGRVILGRIIFVTRAVVISIVWKKSKGLWAILIVAKL